MATGEDVEHISHHHQDLRCPRDLLQRFACSSHADESPAAVALEGGSGEAELSLKLSLGGCFGADPKGKGLFRSTSVASFSFFPKETKEEPLLAAAAAAAAANPALTRTCSLPSVTDEEQKRRKEMQSLRRLEAKRKRTEKRGFNFKTRGDRSEEGDVRQKSNCDSSSSNNNDNNKSNNDDQRQQQLHGWGRAVGGMVSQSQGSTVPHGSCSAGSTDFDCRPMKETRSNSSNQSLASHTDRRTASFSGEEVVDDSPTRMSPQIRMIERMPCVSTKGIGPNGRRIEGFLYKYSEGEEVRIVCVCHGSFLTPAEFVKHAGGGDVEYPLRHIVVCPSPPSSI